MGGIVYYSRRESEIKRHKSEAGRQKLSSSSSSFSSYKDDGIWYIYIRSLFLLEIREILADINLLAATFCPPSRPLAVARGASSHSRILFGIFKRPASGPAIDGGAVRNDRNGCVTPRRLVLSETHPASIRPSPPTADKSKCHTHKRRRERRKAEFLLFIFILFIFLTTILKRPAVLGGKIRRPRQIVVTEFVGGWESS